MIKVMIIDDSLLVRVWIKKILSSSQDIEVIGEAENPIEAFEIFKKVGLPDVFILDVEMPKMDGLTFLKKIQAEKPIPTIMCSSVAEKGSSNAIKALRYGAFDIIQKPKMKLEDSIDDIEEEFISKITAAANSKPIDKTKHLNNELNTPLKVTNKVVAIGSSTGGVQTLEKIFLELQPNHTPIVVVQHMPEGFTTAFAKSLNNVCRNSNIQEAKEGHILTQGDIIIAPGDKHVEVLKQSLSSFKVVLKDYPKVSSHKPSVDVLFTSMVKEVKLQSIPFILTGMGKDGAAGIKKLKDIGVKTYGQDEKTSIVYGMPKVAFDIGGVTQQASLEEIAEIINNIS